MGFHAQRNRSGEVAEVWRDAVRHHRKHRHAERLGCVHRNAFGQYTVDGQPQMTVLFRAAERQHGPVVASQVLVHLHPVHVGNAHVISSRSSALILEAAAAPLRIIRSTALQLTGVDMRITVLIAAIVATMPRPAGAAPIACESMGGVKLSGGSVISAQSIAAGAFAPPDADSARAVDVFKALPAFCRVALKLTPSSDSDIRVEVWLPLSGWNHKIQGAGNGG